MDAIEILVSNALYCLNKQNNTIFISRNCDHKYGLGVINELKKQLSANQHNCVFFDGETYGYSKNSSRVLKELIELLQNNNDKTIIFENCDFFIKEINCINILKSIADNKNFSYVNKDKTENINFTGNIIFVSDISTDEFERDYILRSLISRTFLFNINNI